MENVESETNAVTRKTRLITTKHIEINSIRSKIDGRDIRSTAAKMTKNSRYYDNSTSHNETQDSGVAVDDLNEDVLKKLESRGIRIVDTDERNFARVSPEEVSSYYKSLGDWQNVLPKTDYTYSPVSRFHRKKINGVIPIIPNMSRRNIGDTYDGAAVYDKMYSDKSWKDEMNALYRKKSVQRSRKTDEKSWSASNGTTATSNMSEMLGQTASGTRGFFTAIKLISKFVYTKVTTRSFVGDTKFADRRSRIGAVRIAKVAFVVLVAFFTYWAIARWNLYNIAGSGVDSAYDGIGKIVSRLRYLVLNVYDVTCSSAKFVAGSVWSAYDATAAVSLATPFYNFLHAAKSLATPTTERTSSVNGVKSSQDIENVIRRLLDENKDELAGKILSSDEFARFVDERMKTADGVSTLDKKLTEIERKLETLAKTDAESTRSLQQQLDKLREEILRRETKVEREILVLLAAAVGNDDGDGETPAFDELKKRFASLFRSVEDAHWKIETLKMKLTNTTEATEKLRNEMNDQLRVSMEETVSRTLRQWKQQFPSETMRADEMMERSSLERFVKDVVRKALETYDADKTGRADYALESSGGSILSTRCTETRLTYAQFFIFGLPLWQSYRGGPRSVIQPDVHPGECWAFEGSTGYLVIRLSERIVVTGFTVEHIPRSLAPNGTIDSAPKEFGVWALEHETDTDGDALGTFVFDVNGASLQYFEARRLEKAYQIVELKIMSNHGKVDYTCLYRFRVHGIPT